MLENGCTLFSMLKISKPCSENFRYLVESPCECQISSFAIYNVNSNFLVVSIPNISFLRKFDMTMSSQSFDILTFISSIWA